MIHDQPLIRTRESHKIQNIVHPPPPPFNPGRVKGSERLVRNNKIISRKRILSDPVQATLIRDCNLLNSYKVNAVIITLTLLAM